MRASIDHSMLGKRKRDDNCRLRMAKILAHGIVDFKGDKSIQNEFTQEVLNKINSQDIENALPFMKQFREISHLEKAQREQQAVLCTRWFKRRDP